MAISQNVIFSSSVTKTHLQSMLLAHIKNPVTDEIKVLQLKLQLIEAEKAACADAQAAREAEELARAATLQAEKQAEKRKLQL